MPACVPLAPLEPRAQFKSLLGCMIRHKDYHAPLFDALQMDVERTGEAIGGGGGGDGGDGTPQEGDQG